MRIKRFLLVAVLLGAALLLTFACKSDTSFTKERTTVTTFLRQINKANNNLEDTYQIANLPATLLSGDVTRIRKALSTLQVQLDSYKRQVTEIVAPPSVAELAQLKTLELASADKFQRLVEETKLSTTGSEREAQFFVEQLAELAADPETKRTTQLHQFLLAKYNLPDSEVSYRRP